MSRDTLLVSLTGIASALFLAVGLWAFLDARSRERVDIRFGNRGPREVPFAT